MSRKRVAARRAQNHPVRVEGARSEVLPGKAEKFIPAGIVAAGIIAYWNSLRTPFVFDDRYHIVENVRIRQLWPPWDLLAHSSRPVVHLSLAFNYALGDLKPWGYHVFNLAVHTLAALVLFGIVRRTLLSETLRPRWGAAAPWLAALVAAIWLTHPIQTESVTYTIQRGESLMGLFYLLTLYCVMRIGGPPGDLWWKAGAVASCLLGMASKGGVMATAPLAVVLYDRTFVFRSWGELARQRWRIYSALAATWLCYPLLLANAPEEWKTSAGFAYAGASPLSYALTQPGVILHYLHLALWPDGLCLDYGWPVARTAGDMLPGLIVVGLLLAATVLAWRHRPALGFLGAWFFLILLPTSSFIPIADLAVDHRMYLSLAALVTVAVIAMPLLGRRRPATDLLRLGVLEWTAGGLILLLLTAMTIRRNSDYSSGLAIWTDTVNKSPNNPRAQYDLALALEGAGSVAESIRHYETAVQLRPEYVDALNNLGHILSANGKAAESTPYLRRAVRLKPALAEAHSTLGHALSQQGQTAEAVSELEQAIRIKPDYAAAHNNLAIVLAMNGRTADAIGHWEQALKSDPDIVEAHNNMAYALWQQGRTLDAISHYDQALRLKPDYVQAKVSLARLLATAGPAQGGNPGRAVSLALHACELTGNRVAANLDTLAIAYAAAGRFDDAVRTAQKAIDVARSAGQPDLAREIEGRLESYRRGRA